VFTRQVRARHRAVPASRRRVARLGGVLAALVVLLSGWGISTAATASAAPTAAPGAIGYDVSTPQCGRTLPEIGAFGIVGVNGGRAFSLNPCFASQYEWAKRRPAASGVYINTGNPAPRSDYYWPASGSRDPALCRDNTSTRDPGCAYDYGWHAAAAALAAADRVDPTSRSRTWWLDIETANSWNGDGIANAADLQGVVDLLRSKGVARVGLYSTAYQWRTITGGYTASSAGTYRTAWRSAFTPRYRLESVPLWIATMGDAAAAKTACTTSFTGGPAQMVQFVDGSGLDANYVCRR
jgi:hypothetical protein